MADFTASLADNLNVSIASGATWAAFIWGVGVWGYGNPGDLWTTGWFMNGSDTLGFSQFEGSLEEILTGNGFKLLFGGSQTNAENRNFPVYNSTAANVTSWTCAATAGGAWV